VSIRINSTFADGAVIAGIVAGFVFGNLLSPAAGADAARIPNFADPGISWSLEGRLDDLLPPTSRPSPVMFDPAHQFRGQLPGRRSLSQGALRYGTST
jgi:hypothetical protein